MQESELILLENRSTAETLKMAVEHGIIDPEFVITYLDVIINDINLYFQDMKSREKLIKYIYRLEKTVQDEGYDIAMLGYNREVEELISEL